MPVCRVERHRTEHVGGVFESAGTEIEEDLLGLVERIARRFDYKTDLGRPTQTHQSHPAERWVVQLNNLRRGAWREDKQLVFESGTRAAYCVSKESDYEVGHQPMKAR
jgi:hypothetical protein